MSVSSVSVVWDVCCDFPGCGNTYEGISPSCMAVIGSAVSDGWEYSRGETMCPVHGKGKAGNNA